MRDDDNRTVYCGNLSEQVTDSVLFELFNQAGPVESVRRIKDQNGHPKTFAFIVYKHECSVPYSIELFKETKLFNRNLNINSRNTLEHIPVLNTHLTEFSDPWKQQRNYGGNYPVRHREDSSTYQRNDSSHVQEDSFQSNKERSFQESETHNNWDRVKGHKHKRHHRKGSKRHSDSDKDSKEPTSWAEFNALKGKGSLAKGLFQDDLQVPSGHKRDSNPNLLPATHDFNMLLQMGQQMMIPGMMGPPGITPGYMPMMGLGPGLGGSNMYPSMQGRMSGGQSDSSGKDRGHREHHERRGERRDHPYDRKAHERNDGHKRHERGYSSSKSSHERERRDRRST